MTQGQKIGGVVLAVIGYIAVIWGSRLEEQDDKNKTVESKFLVFGGIVAVFIGAVLIISNRTN